MSNQTITSDKLAETIMSGLMEYAELAAEDMKEIVKSTGEETKENIRNTAPKRTGKYAKSWTSDKISETADSLTVSVHSKTRYRLTHLLEFGHAKRGGGRVSARPHIAAAEKKAEQILTAEIAKSLKG